MKRLLTKIFESKKIKVIFYILAFLFVCGTQIGWIPDSLRGVGWGLIGMSQTLYLLAIKDFQHSVKKSDVIIAIIISVGAIALAVWYSL